MKPYLIEHTLRNYEIALSRIENYTFPIEDDKKLPFEEDILDILTHRDVVKSVICSRLHPPSKRLFKLSRLDKILREKGPKIAQNIDLKELRNSFHPPSDAWWWFFETPKSNQWWDRYDRLWNFLALFFLILSVTIILSISTRLLSGEPDTIGTFILTIQTALTTLVAGAILTNEKLEIVDKILNRLNIPIHFKQEGRLLLSIGLFILLLLLNSSLASISILYNNIGYEYQLRGALSRARVNYSRSIKFDPDNLGARFNLALLFERLNNFESARHEYELVTQGGFSKGYNNLARLDILEGRYSEAVILLLRGEKIVEDENVKYSILKNLGWARLKQERFSEAQAHLKKAITINPERAPAHCLMAKVLDKRDRKAQALEEWKVCLRKASPLAPDEDEWIGEAKKRVLPDNTKIP